MSESSQAVVRLDTDIDVAQVANRALAFLLDRRIVVRNDRRDELRLPSEWAHGTLADSVVEAGWPDWKTLANSGVDVILAREAHVPIEAYEPAWCDRCRATFDEDEHFAALEAWVYGPEPILTCHACGWSALMGDWPIGSGTSVGAPAVRFYNWPPLTEQFVGELRAVVGGRTQLVRAYY